MIHLAVPNLDGNERAYLNKCIDTTFVSSVGEFVNNIENMSAEACGAKYGVATSCGTTALHLSLIACGVKYGDIVIIPSFTFIATANAVAHCGATPWLMDINKDSWTMDVELLKNEIEENTEFNNGILIHKESGKRVAAIMPVYTLGNVADMDMINEIAGKYNLPVIADAACAIGAEYKDKKIGELATLTTLSFNGNKTVTAGGGGAVVGNDEEVMKLIKHISTTARVNVEYDFDMVGYNYRMTNIQAAVGCAQLERLEKFIERKRYVRQFYFNELNCIDGIDFFPEPSYQKSTCWFSGIVLESGGLEDVRKICSELKNKDIEARSFWKPIHLQEPYRHAIKASSLQISDGLWDRIVTLPCSTNITDEELFTVTSALKEIL